MAPEWIPTAASAKGRLVLSAVKAFGSRPYDAVSVADLAEASAVTTGAIYHHFGSKSGLYDLVRLDVERRVLDRIDGAAAARVGDPPGQIAATALGIAFDYLADTGLSRLVASEHPLDRPDPISSRLAALLDTDGTPVSVLLCAAWRAALLCVADGTPAPAARAAFDRLTALTFSA